MCADVKLLVCQVHLSHAACMEPKKNETKKKEKNKELKQNPVCSDYTILEIIQAVMREERTLRKEGFADGCGS